MDYQKDLIAMFSTIDKQWIQRRRLLDTMTIFCDMVGSALTQKGLEFIIHTHNKHYTPAAICKARQHLPDDTFRKVNDGLILKHANASHIFAIDGSKFYVPSSFRSMGFKSRTNDVEVPRKAKRPIAMLSSLVDVERGVCFDYCVSQHFNERQSAVQHLNKLHKGDIVLFDRGYFSAQLYSEFTAKGVDCVFRLKCDSFKAVKAFVASKHHNTTIRTVVRGQKVHIRLLKYYVKDKQYIIGTSLFQHSRKQIANLYRKRWSVELSFRRLKSNLHLNYTFTLKENTWKHAIQARVLADTISILSSETTKSRPLYSLHDFVRRHSFHTMSHSKGFKDVIYVIYHRSSTQLITSLHGPGEALAGLARQALSWYTSTPIHYHMWATKCAVWGAICPQTLLFTTHNT